MPDPVSIACIGGMDMDRKAKLQAPAILGSSNPAETEAMPGGVARNVAETLARLGLPVSLFSAVGDDPAGTTVLRQTIRAGVDVSGVARQGRAKTATYTAILQPDGELVIGIADMAILDRLDAHWGRLILPDLAPHDIWFVDANLPEPVLQVVLAAAARASRTVLADPVSAAKAPRLRSVIGAIDVLFPDRLEAAALTGLTVDTAAEALSAAAALQAAGIGTVIVTLGAEGLAFDDGRRRAIVPPPPVETVRDVTGAGDAFIAGYIFGLCAHGTAAALSYGRAAAGLVLETGASVPDALSAAKLEHAASGQ